MSTFGKRAVTVAGLVCLLGQSALATAPYTGSLTIGGGGLTGTGAWGDGPSQIQWTVADLGGGMWSYAYNLTVPSKGISHLIIETSPTFTSANISSISSSVPLEAYEIDTFNGQGNSNPGLPESFYGVKFELDDDATSVEISFTSDRDPIWGDFFAKDGNQKNGNTNGNSRKLKKVNDDNTTPVSIWNTGFTSPDSDPSADPLIVPPSGTIDNHLLVPDTAGNGFIIPEPLTLVGIAMGLTGLGAALWRKTRRA